MLLLPLVFDAVVWIQLGLFAYGCWIVLFRELPALRFLRPVSALKDVRLFLKDLVAFFIMMPLGLLAIGDEFPISQGAKERVRKRACYALANFAAAATLTPNKIAYHIAADYCRTFFTLFANEWIPLDSEKGNGVAYRQHALLLFALLVLSRFHVFGADGWFLLTFWAGLAVLLFLWEESMDLARVKKRIMVCASASKICAKKWAHYGMGADECIGVVRHEAYDAIQTACTAATEQARERRAPYKRLGRLLVIFGLCAQVALTAIREPDTIADWRVNFGTGYAHRIAADCKRLGEELMAANAAAFPDDDPVSDQVMYYAQCYREVTVYADDMAELVGNANGPLENTVFKVMTFCRLRFDAAAQFIHKSLVQVMASIRCRFDAVAQFIYKRFDETSSVGKFPLMDARGINQTNQESGTLFFPDDLPFVEEAHCSCDTYGCVYGQFKMLAVRDMVAFMEDVRAAVLLDTAADTPHDSQAAHLINEQPSSAELAPEACNASGKTLCCETYGCVYGRLEALLTRDLGRSKQFVVGHWNGLPAFGSFHVGA